MHSFIHTLLSSILPALVVPALLTVATAAQASLLDISNCFYTQKVQTTYGFDFSFGHSGKFTRNGISHPTTLEFDCSVYTTAHDVHCEGFMTLDDDIGAVLWTFDGGTDKAAWKIDEVDIDIDFDHVYNEWGWNVMPDIIPVAGGLVRREDGSYYSSDWAAIRDRITNLPI
ncbi:MAG TPA: hypothetical protein VGB85_14075 [Nannocystis sp.]